MMWDKLDSTPYGHCTAPDGSSIVRPVDEKLAALQRSHVHMDHYTYPDSNAVRNFCLFGLYAVDRSQAHVIIGMIARTGPVRDTYAGR